MTVSRYTGLLAASDYIRANEADNEHMDAEGHRIFVSVLCEKLEEIYETITTRGEAFENVLAVKYVYFRLPDSIGW